MKISRVPMAIVFAAALALLATDAMAQRGEGPGGRRGPGGIRGGFPGPGMMGRGGGMLGLLQLDKVQEELELLPDQKEALGKIAQNRPRPERPEGIDFGDRSEENRAKVEEFMEKMRKQREEFETKAVAQLEEVLFPEQMERLKQIEIQVAGVRALTQKNVAEELKLSESQQKELREVAENVGREMMGKMRELFQSGQREGIREKMEAARKESEEKLLSVLTTEQKNQFEAMKGDPFEMPEFGRGGFGRGRGGDGDRGRGGFRRRSRGGENRPSPGE
jgi:Spy/CpxP family protein refolding chaperone